MTVHKLKLITIILSLSAISSSALASVPLWKDFKTGMSPEEVLETLKSLDLAKISKRSPKVNPYPKNPRFRTSSSYDWVPTNRSVRVKWKHKERDFALANHYATGPNFGFDTGDKLTQVSFTIQSNAANPAEQMLSLGCYNPIQKVGDANFNFFKSALSSKYEVVGQDIKGGEGTSVIIFKNEGTRILLERNTTYQKSLDSAVFKCDKWTSRVRLTYGDYERVSNLIGRQNSEEAEEFKNQLEDL